jgi:single-strand DNA-binding protein
MRVIVVAKPEQRTWEDKDSGQKRSVVEFVVSEIGPSSRGLESAERKASTSNGEGGAPKRPGAKGPAASRKDIPEDDEPF